MHIYIHTVYTVHICIYIYMYTERERWRHSKDDIEYPEM